MNRIVVAVTLGLAIACGSVGVDSSEPAATAAPVDISSRVPASGTVEFIIRPGPVVVLDGVTFPLSELERFTTRADTPLADRTAILIPENVTYADVIQVVDILLKGDCVDVKFRGAQL